MKAVLPILFTFFFIILTEYAFTQKQFTFNSISLGVGAVPYFDSDENTNYKDRSWALNTKIEIHLLKKWHFGVNRMHHFGIVNGVRQPYLYLDQPYILYDLINREKIRLFIAGNFSVGNFCACEARDPYTKREKKYWGLGGGLETKLWHRFYFEYSMIALNHFRLPAPGISRHYGFNSFIGFNYKQSLKKEK